MDVDDPFAFYFENDDFDLEEIVHYSTNKSFFNDESRYNLPVISLYFPKLNKMEFIALDEYAVEEIIFTIDSILKYCVCMTDEMKLKAFSTTEYPIKRQLKKAKQKGNFEMFKDAVNVFNSKIRSAAEVHYVVGYLNEKVPNMFVKLGKESEYSELKSRLESVNPDLVEHVYEQAYNRIIEPKLNELTKYQAFSDNTYGEITFMFVQKMIEVAKMNESSVFVDLGSGIGNVVCQVAALAKCESYGIEVMQNTASLSFDLKKEFCTRLSFYNQKFGKIGLYKGDIMSHPQVHLLLKQASVVFVNNYVFSPQTNQSLQQHFLDLQDGSIIVSMKSFAPNQPLENRITIRNANHIESILHVTEHEYFADYVSWSDAPGTFFVHVVDRKPLNEFLMQNSR